MKQIVSERNQSGFLDPEKVYFVEKFGYLIKNIDNGFGGPVQDALVKRIFLTVEKFKKDLPNVVQNLEKKRLKHITAKKNIYKFKSEISKTVIPKRVDKKPEPIEPKKEVVKVEAPVVEKKAIETEIEVAVKEPMQTSMPKVSATNSSSILRPSAAALIEENRQKQLRKIQEQKIAESEKKAIPLVTRPNVRPKKELTVWERAWHRYGGYTEEAMNGRS